MGDARLIYIFAATLVLAELLLEELPSVFLVLHTHRDIKGPASHQASVRHRADIPHSIFTRSATKVLLVSSSSRSSAVGKLSNFLKIIATELQKLDL